MTVIVWQPIVMEYAWVAKHPVELTVALTVKLNGPVTVGWPDKTPEIGFNDNPAGNEPAEIAQLICPLPPDKAID